MDGEFAVHCQVERGVHRTDKGLAAVGITAKVGIAHPNHEIQNTFTLGIDGGCEQEEGVAAFHKGVGRGGTFFFGNRHGVIHQRVVRDVAIPVHGDGLVGGDTEFLGEGFSQLHL